MKADLLSVLEELAASVRREARGFGADHVRWQLYEQVIAERAALDLLLRAVELEEDHPLAASVVVRVLEVEPDGAHEKWLRALDVSNQAYSRRRSAEIGVLRRARNGPLPPEELAEGVRSWTDWLQSRLAAEVEHRATLAVLASDGRTKRVRRTAAERVKGIG